MAIGSGAVLGFDSLVGLAEETTYGTFVTATSFVEFNSESLNRNINYQKLNSIFGRRGFQRMVEGQTDVSGDINFNLHAVNGLILLKNAMAGSITTLAVVGATHASHTFALGDWSVQTASASFSIQKRVGSTTARTFLLSGCRVNQLAISGAINQPVQCVAGIIGQNLTSSAASSMGATNFSTVRPFLFFDGTYTSDNTTSSWGTTVDDILSFELTINNNIVSDDKARRIGSRFVRLLPAGQREINLSISQRFDTMTAFESWLANTQHSIRIHLDTGLTIGSAAGNTTYSMRFDFRNVRIMEGAVPQVGDNGVVTYDLNLSPLLVDASNTTTSDEMLAVVFTSLATL